MSNLEITSAKLVFVFIITTVTLAYLKTANLASRAMRIIELAFDISLALMILFFIIGLYAVIFKR